MLRRAGTCIFVGELKMVDGEKVNADGCITEYELSLQVGCIAIPIGASESAARKIWQTMNDSRDEAAAYRHKLSLGLWDRLTPTL